MTTPPSLPALPGLGWSRHKKPGFNTRIASHVSGREVRLALQVNPLYEFEAVLDGLSSASSPAEALSGLGASSLQSLMGFFLQMQGQFGTFLYSDPDDGTVSGGAIATGDGTTQSFVIPRVLGGFAEACSWVTNVANVYLNGVDQAPANWVFMPPNSIGFYAAPGAGVAITADFSFAFQCRFIDDQMDFDEFMAALWKLDSLKFRSIKANTAAASLPPPTVTGVSPSSGTNSGGTPVTITGTGFLGATGVTVGGATATAVTVVNSTTITCTTPAGSVGTANVAVTTTSGTGIGASLFTYTAWYSAYAIGSALPSIFADWTTEGAANHYLYNGTTYAGFAALLTALGGTFSRASTKYITNSSGNLASISSGALPFDYSPTSVGTLNGLLLEGASTNLILYSSMSNSALATGWSTANNSATTDGTLAPDGSTASIISNLNNGTGLYTYLPSVISLSSGAVYTASFFAKASSVGINYVFISGSGAGSQIYFDIKNGLIKKTTGSFLSSPSITAYGNGWYRITVQFTGATGVTIAFGLTDSTLSQTFTPTGADQQAAYVWGAQIEALPFASSYIATTSSSATRAADNLELPWTSATATFVVKSINQTYAASASVDLLAANTNSNGDAPLQMASATSLAAVDSAATLTKSTAVTSWAVSNISGVSGNGGGRALTANNLAAVTDGNALFMATPATIWIGGGNATAAYGDMSQFRGWSILATGVQLQAQTSLA
jgi:hypothetical protein